jgi:tripartite-type tricarboxylate transporter receptor subunit TctC
VIKCATAAATILSLVLLAALTGPTAAQQPYPIKPIRFIVPFPPGGSTDPTARMVAQKLVEKWGQPVIVDNRPGGNTVIGTDAVAKASPDGYTILLATTPFVTGPSLIPYLPYDAIKDFDAVATIAKNRHVLVLGPAIAANTLQEFIALAKSKPGQLNYASTGVGGTTHLAGELFNIMVGTKLQHIPYKGSGPVLANLIGGQVQLSFQIPISVIPHILSGKLKALAITGENRLALLPQVPTFTEAGLPGYDISGWYWIVAPARTPKAIIDKMSSEIAAILAMPDIQENLARQGIEPFVSTPEQFAALIRTEIARYAKIIKTANIKLENQ